MLCIQRINPPGGISVYDGCETVVQIVFRGSPADAHTPQHMQPMLSETQWIVARSLSKSQPNNNYLRPARDTLPFSGPRQAEGCSSRS